MTDNRKMTGGPKRMAAGSMLLGAARIRVEAQSLAGRDPSSEASFRYADQVEAAVRVPIPFATDGRGAGGELVPTEANGYQPAPELRDTVRDPDYVAADASRDRLELANQANALGLALDVADTAGARNSIERMLCHQLAAVHRVTMKLAGQLGREIEGLECKIDPRHREVHNLHATRLAAATARMLAAFNDGAITLQRLRSGGRQVVTVQHVQVNEGGKAIVAGSIRGRGKSRSKRRGSK